MEMIGQFFRKPGGNFRKYLSFFIFAINVKMIYAKHLFENAKTKLARFTKFRISLKWKKPFSINPNKKLIRVVLNLNFYFISTILVLFQHATRTSSPPPA
jgi:hypothetical protein